jgi:transcriptional regulator with XRE-family HTH domain
MANQLDKRVGARIRLLRQRAGLSARELALRLTFGVAQLTAFEAGDVRISASNLFRLTRTLGVKVSDIFAFEGCSNFARFKRERITSRVV